MCDVSKIIEELNSYKYISKPNSKPIAKNSYVQQEVDTWAYMRMLDSDEIIKLKGENNA